MMQRKMIMMEEVAQSSDSALSHQKYLKTAGCLLINFFKEQSMGEQIDEIFKAFQMTLLNKSH